MSVPFVDLRRAEDHIRDELREAFERVSGATAYILGPDVEEFEREFAAYCGAAHCVGLSDGTEALRLALLALGAGPGREVVAPAMTFIATVEAIAATGARPVLVDVDPVTRCADPAALARAVGPDTAAIVPVHLYGRIADIPDVGVPVLEDACQAHGADRDGRRAGTFGAAAAFSFYPSKNLGALGDGGAVVTSDDELAALVRSLRAHGSEPGNANHHLRPGATGRLDTLQAAFLRAKLPHLDGWNEQRRAAAARYRELLDGLPLGLPPEDPAGGRQVFHLFVVEVDDRDRVLAGLRAGGIGAAVHYPTACHLQPAWRHLGYGEDAFPAAEALAARGLSLPIFPGITDAELETVVTALRGLL